MSKYCGSCMFADTLSVCEPCAGCLSTYPNPRFPNWRPKDCTNKDCEVKGEDTCQDCEFKVTEGTITHDDGTKEEVSGGTLFMTAKQNDQTAKADAGKPRLTLIPLQILYDIAKVREYGCNKYPEGGTENWRKVDIQRYRDAAFRHFVEYLNEPSGIDEESGIYHLAHLACNIAFLCELEHEKLQGAPDHFCGSCKYCEYDWELEPCWSCSNKDDHWEGK